MDLFASIVIATALALATGVVAGYGLSVVGWIMVSVMLIVTLVVGGVLGQIEPVAVLLLFVLAIFGFNVGLFAGLVQWQMVTKAAK